MCSYLNLLCRNTSGTFSSMGPSTPAWSIDNTTLNRSYYTGSLLCVNMYKIFSILTVIICVVGLTGNAIVLWLLGFHMNRNAFSVYVLNLAGADFLYMCSQTVFSLRHILFLFDVSYFNIPFILPNVLIFAYLSGLCMITAISVERCLSVLYPIWYHCRRPRHMSSVLCALLWIFSLLLSLLLWLGCILLISGYEYSFCDSAIFTTVVFIIVISVVTCGFNLALLVRIFCGSERIPVTRLYVTIALTVLVFLLFGLPFGIYLVIDFSSETSRVFSCNFYTLSAFLSCVNSCANPIIYFLVGSIRHRRFQRQTLKVLLQRAIQDTPEEEDGERGYSGNTGQQETALCSS
ncbi:mas-related G-protein coupled receptor member B4-like [Peromyscus californicus insignis]|uniref:mas-related G-protein coupled receptor member B4-like n=1 Tax=Peromyscus californicus insignis TaxID=564181 RepID=UPI0022A6CF00|nr:mas-related G-protein coupled receptor member B4-like [Peromyscus californicus insignis]